MKITNVHNLPESVYNVLSANNYDPGKSDYSATTLLKPVQQVILERRYWDELTEDCIDRIWSVFGTAVHNLLDCHADIDAMSEQRLYVECLGKKIGGQVDHYKDGTIEDYKVTSAWTIVYGSRIKEWEEQLNIYAHIFRANNYSVNNLRVNAFLRDWDKYKAKVDLSYPQAPFIVIELPLWGSEKAADFIYNKVNRLFMSEDEPDDRLPLCKPEDMWEQPTKYAVKKKGNKKATKLWDDEGYAQIDAKKRGKEFFVETRPGKRTRCEEYCSVAHKCHQYKAYTNGKES